ncbi:MAG: hypothetical protein K9M02_01525 [Thiohalocapsa sp.]|nr:hypothetical protein [Thiohalocapsa sp.]
MVELRLSSVRDRYIVSTEVSPKWSAGNLADHLDKRRRNDEACWVEILKHPAPMTEQEYKHASYDAYARAVIEYEAEEQRHARRIHRLDGRGIKITFSTDRRVMITCFHFHRGRRHEPRSVSKSVGEKCAELLDVIEERAEAGELSLFAIKAEKNNLPKGKLRSKSGPLMMKISALRKRFGLHG